MRVLGLVWGVSLLVACSTPPAPTQPAVPLTNTFASVEDLTRAVLEGLRARDLPRLRELALSEAEFRVHVWPELPTSRPERNVPFDYAWGQLAQRSSDALTQTVARYGGRSLALVRVSFTGETTRYATFSVRRDSEVVAADETGREWILRLFGSVLVKDGRHKLFSYVADD